MVKYLRLLCCMSSFSLRRTDVVKLVRDELLSYSAAEATDDLSLSDIDFDVIWSITVLDIFRILSGR